MRRKNSTSLGLEAGNPPSMKWMPSSSSLRAMRTFSSTETRHALALHAVAQGGVVELYLPLVHRGLPVPSRYLRAYSMKSPNSSSLPDVMAANRSCMRRVMGPGSPMKWSSTSRIGTTSAAVPV